MTDDEGEKLKDEIISSMAMVEDKHHRVVLSLMIRIMSTQERFINDIFGKLDTIIQDEQRIREIALNGHLEDHSKHHEWVKNRMDEESQNKRDLKAFFKTRLGNAVTYIFILLAGFHLSKWLPKLFGGS